MHGKAQRMAAESRPRALWVSPEIFSRAQELADLLGVDVDTLIDFAVTLIQEDVTAEGQVRGKSRMATGRVTGLDPAMLSQREVSPFASSSRRAPAITEERSNKTPRK